MAKKAGTKIPADEQPSDDLLYLSVCRLKKMIELNAPNGLILRELALAIRFAVEKTHYPEEFAERCVDRALEREQEST